MRFFSVSGLVEWTKNVFIPFGPIGLFLVAFMESSFFPIPPDLILIPLVLVSPELGLVYAFIATIGSVTGSVLGYYIGKKGGKPLLERLISKEKMERLIYYFDKHGTLGIAIAGFSFIPYKIFTIASGVFNFPIIKMIVASIFSRGARFFLIAITLMLYGNFILDTITNYLYIFTFLAILLFLLYFLFQKRKKQFNK